VACSDLGGVCLAFGETFFCVAVWFMCGVIASVMLSR